MIVCSIKCMYQTDGVCMLDRAASAGLPFHNDGCIHYIPRSESPNVVKSLELKK